MSNKNQKEQPTYQEQIDKVEAEIKRLQKQKNFLKKKHDEENIKAKRERLIGYGEFLESFVDGLDDLTNDQITILLQSTVGSKYGVRELGKIKDQ